MNVCVNWVCARGVPVQHQREVGAPLHLPNHITVQNHDGVRRDFERRLDQLRAGFGLRRAAAAGVLDST